MVLLGFIGTYLLMKVYIGWDSDNSHKIVTVPLKSGLLATMPFPVTLILVQNLIKYYNILYMYSHRDVIKYPAEYRECYKNVL